MRTIADIRYSGAHERCLLDLYLPDAAEVFSNGKIPLFIDFHGGGLTGGDKNGKAALAAELAGRGIATAAVRYRLYPGAKYPEFIEDAADAVAWAFANYAGYIAEPGASGGAGGGLMPGGIFAGGESAGAYLSMMLCFDGGYLARRGIDSADLAGYIHASGQTTVHFNVAAERGLDPRRVIADEAAPVYHVGTAEKVAPMLFITSDMDMYNRLEQNRLIYRTLLHFYPDADARLIELEGRHCEFMKRPGEGGGSEYGGIVAEFILGHVQS